jgi:Sulfotransferase family
MTTADQATAPVVIYGAPRSGTTYLAALLNAHPEVHITNEVRLWVWAHRALAGLDHPQALYSLREEFAGHVRRELPELIRGFYREHWPQARVWGDKNPHYASAQHLGVLETIVQLHPGAKFIHVIRDGRDVVASLIRKRHDTGELWLSSELAHEMWVNHVTTGHDFAAAAPAGTVLEIRYEDVVADDLAAARTLFAFLDLDVHPAVVEFCERESRQRTPVSGPTRDLDQGAGRSEWETVMGDEDQRRRSLDVLRESLVRFGYPV